MTLTGFIVRTNDDSDTHLEPTDEDEPAVYRTAVESGCFAHFPIDNSADVVASSILVDRTRKACRDAAGHAQRTVPNAITAAHGGVTFIGVEPMQYVIRYRLMHC